MNFNWFWPRFRSHKKFLGPLYGILLILILVLGTEPVARAQTPPLGAVATQHPLATETAAKILRKGGNAIDAVVAAALTLAVVEPYYSGLGAGGLALLWKTGGKKAYALDFRERAPLASIPGMFMEAGVPPDASENGPLAIAVPGEIQGLATLHRRGGRLPWAELFGDAIRFAEDGFPPDEVLITQAENKKDCLRRDYDSSQIYQGLWSGKPMALWRQPALAQTLKRLAAEGPDIFYQGALGSSLVSDLQGKGALLSVQDLGEYQTVQRDPLSAKFSWGELWGFPLPSSGGISLVRGLQTMEAVAKGKRDKSLKNDWMPWMVQVLSQVFQTRNTEMGDGDFVPDLPVKKWISRSFAKQEAKKILETPNPGETMQGPTKSGSKSESQTTHLSVLDAEGNAVAMTLTQNLSLGSCVSSGSTGITMNNQMDDFTTRPGQPNYFGLIQSEANGIAPGKRPLSSMAPTLVIQKGRVILVLGTRGGPRILSTLLEVLYRYFFLGETLAQAIAAPRFHYQGIPNEIDLEQAGQRELKKSLQILKLPFDLGESWCDVQAVGLDLKTNAYFALSDPRGQGKALVVFPKRVPTGE
jgi:gamma-glutamyltranspeptidase/glutathione hydrolase